MSEQAVTETSLLPLPAPEADTARLMLFAFRRMAAHGLSDAHAANALLGRFGLGYRRPLILLRAFMLELSRVSQRSIMVAPCCAGRMTHDEGRIVGALSLVHAAPPEAFAALVAVTGGANVLPALSAAMAVNDTLADMGRAL